MAFLDTRHVELLNSSPSRVRRIPGGQSTLECYNRVDKLSFKHESVHDQKRYKVMGRRHYAQPNHEKSGH